MKNVVQSYRLDRPELAKLVFPLYIIDAIGYDACVSTSLDGSPDNTFPTRPGRPGEEIALDWYRLNVISLEARAILQSIAISAKHRLESQMGVTICTADTLLPDSLPEYWKFLPEYEGSSTVAPQWIHFPVFDNPNVADQMLYS